MLYYCQKMNHDEEIKHFHRFRGYDYSRGAAMMLSFHLEPRVPVFGRVNGNRMEYSDIGMIARKVLAKERDRTPDVQLKKSIIMPEHVHLRLYLRPGQERPLERMGRFVYNFKAWTRNHAKKAGVEIAWQKNYHDWILPSREIISLAASVGMVLMMRLGRLPRQLAANRSMCVGILARESNGILRSKPEEGVA